MITEREARRGLCKICSAMEYCRFLDDGDPFATCGSFINLLQRSGGSSP